MNADILSPAWIPAIPLIGAVLIVLVGRKPNLREGVTLFTGLAVALAVGSLVAPVLSGQSVSAHLLTLTPDLVLSLKVEPLGLIYALVASCLWIVNSIYSIGYVRAKKEKNQTRYYACFALAIGAAMGIAFAADLITLFIFYEFLTLVTFPLVTHAGTETAKKGGRTYLSLLLATSLGPLFLAIVSTGVLADTLEFRDGGILGAGVSPGMLALLLGLFAYGFGKAALMPLHRWLPAAMVAPTPVSALLHAVAVVKAGVFALTKVVLYVFDPRVLAEVGASDWLVIVASASIVIASLIALRQDNLKRRLAYSTVAQLSYVTLGAALAVPAGLAGASLQILAHAVAKITLFFGAGAIYVASGKTEVSQLAGIGRRMPFTMVAFGVASLSLIGLPPTLGMWSKWWLLQGALETRNPWAIVALGLGTLLATAYLFPVFHAAFFMKEETGGENAPTHGEAPWPMVLALCVTAILAVALFFLPSLPFDLAFATWFTRG